MFGPLFAYPKTQISLNHSACVTVSSFTPRHGSQYLTPRVSRDCWESAVGDNPWIQVDFHGKTLLSEVQIFISAQVDGDKAPTTLQVEVGDSIQGVVTTQDITIVKAEGWISVPLAVPLWLLACAKGNSYLRQAEEEDRHQNLTNRVSELMSILQHSAVVREPMCSGAEDSISAYFLRITCVGRNQARVRGLRIFGPAKQGPPFI